MRGSSKNPPDTPESECSPTAAPKVSVPRRGSAAIHTQRDGEPGIWFRLHSGKVFSSAGEPESRDPADYGGV